MNIMDLGDLETIELCDLCDLRDRICAEIAKREATTMRIKGHIVDFLNGREAADREGMAEAGPDPNREAF